jgi:hypothetical protein
MIIYNHALIIYNQPARVSTEGAYCAIGAGPRGAAKGAEDGAARCGKVDSNGSASPLDIPPCWRETWRPASPSCLGSRMNPGYHHFGEGALP